MAPSSPRKTFDVGAPVVTRQPIAKANQNIRILNPDILLGESIPAGSLGRIHSTTRHGVKTVWLLDEMSYSTVMVEIPDHMLGLLLAPREHRVFPHFA